MYLSAYKTIERKKGGGKCTAWDNCSSWLGCRAKRLNFTPAVSHLNVLSNSAIHNSKIIYGKSLMNNECDRLNQEATPPGRYAADTAGNENGDEM